MEWQDPEAVNENIEKPHATFIPYFNPFTACWEYPKQFIPLSGKWKFFFQITPSIYLATSMMKILTIVPGMK